MLFGEHAVVYNRPCLVTAVSSRLSVEFEKKSQRLAFKTPPNQDTRFLNAAEKIFREKYQKHSPVIISTRCDFSARYGLGSSAAVTVATIFALAEFHRIKLTRRQIFTLSYQAIQKVQGVGSGFDAAASCFGGTLYFLTGGKIIQPLKITTLPLVVGYSGVKADTTVIVKQIRKAMTVAKRKKEIEVFFNDMAKIVDEAKTALESQNWPKAGELMQTNQKLLQKLGVSTTKLDKLCQAAVAAGAWGAKLSGAGGGDCMIALVSPEKRPAVTAAITVAGGQTVEVEVHAEGVRRE